MGMVGAPETDESCPVCGVASPPLAFVKNGYPMHRCVSCELVYSSRPPAGDKLEALYSAEYFTDGGAGYPDYIADERTHRHQARTYLKRIAKLGATPGSLLDIGCAAGFFLDEARRVGWQVRGCELSAYAHAHASKKLGLDVVRAGFLDPAFAPPPQSFDVITLFNVLEHIPNPTAVVDKMFSLLRPGGHLVVETWDPHSLLARALGSRWPTYAPPTVLYCFTKRTLAHLFDSTKWTRISYRPSMKWISLDHGLSLLEYEVEHTPLARVTRSVFGAVRRSFVGGLDVPYCLGDLALAVFRRGPAHSFRLEWNGAARAKLGAALSPGTTA
jgi:2-polyprenyl-3-methyl-5-hydroxy-6-metoxy-1,4-benzoquinol methylase